jgi:GNAT superfamily N-acetyltransferase
LKKVLIMNYDSDFTYEELNDVNVKDVYEFCELNVDHWTQPFEFFKLASLGDTEFNPKLSIVIKDKANHVVAFFFGTTRKSMVINRKVSALKFFVVSRELRRQGLATFLYTKLNAKFKELGINGTIDALTCPPDYWFSGVNPKFTAALFWLKSMGFKQHSSVFLAYRQDLYVDFDNSKIMNSLKLNFSKEPPTEQGNYRFQRVSEEFYDKTYEFVKKEFHGVWPLECKLSFRNNPPTTFIAIDKASNTVVGFATYNAHFDGSFGPTGVLKSLRGHGIGGILLLWTLYDLKKTGHNRCQILWVTGNTVKYYSKVAGAYIGQIYFPMSSKIK